MVRLTGHTGPVSHLLDKILGLDPTLILVVTGLLVFAEDAIFLGFVIPGETAAVLAGVGAGLGNVPLALSLVVVIVAAIVGDSVGYEVGRHLGARILDLPLLARRRERLDAARDLLSRRGGSAVFLGRWVAFFRAVMPALAGTARMPYGRFLAFNAAGGLAWGVTVVLVGYAAGASYAQVEKYVGRDAALVVLAVVVIALVVWRVRRR